MADDDPRQDGAFAAAWTLGFATGIAPAGVQVWTPAGLTGPRGLFRDDGSPGRWPPWSGHWPPAPGNPCAGPRSRLAAPGCSAAIRSLRQT
ncbi:hypothetical protein ACFSHQ_25345 [Gemmobacter lanyuensis]